MAVMAKEWRRLVRAHGTPWMLAFYLFGPILLAAVSLRGASVATPGIQQRMHLVGLQALGNVGAGQLVLLALWVPWVCGSLMAAEFEERTLEPYLAAGGRLAGLVAGKWLAAVAFFSLVLLAGLPAFALPFLLGGVNWTLLGRTLALEGALVMAAAGLGLVVSALGRRVAGTALVALTLGLVLTLGTGLAAGLRTTAGPFTDRDLKLLLMSRMPTPEELQADPVPKWLFSNPLVGLNSALSQPAAQAALGLPGAGVPPVFRGFSLWHVQVAGGAVAGLMSLLMGLALLALRLRLRVPAVMVRRRMRKGVVARGA